jgi:heat shock protein HtpX
MTFGSYWFSDKIVLAMYGAKRVEERNMPQLYNLVRELAINAGLPMPKVYIIETATPNAFATGRSPGHSAVAVTTGALNLLSTSELRGVLGHELAHIKNRDTLISTIAATIATAIYYIAHMAQFTAFFGGSRDERGGGVHPLVLLIIALVAPVAAIIIQMAISRQREYAADASGAKLCGNSLYLADALNKLAYGCKRNPLPHGDPTTAHLFIVNPFAGGGWLALFSTHPPIQERIKRLKAMAR